MHENGSLPRARQDGLLVDTVGEELLLYDQENYIAHCLSPIAACVWRHCDGARDVTELAILAGVSDNLVADALHELREKQLLDAEPQLMQSTVPGISRREAISRGVRYGAAAAAAPLIVSATAATPAMADSGNPNCKTATQSLNCCVCKTNMGPLCKSATTSRLLCERECLPSEGFGREGIEYWSSNLECN